MFEINKTLLWISLGTCFYVGFKLGEKKERIRKELGL